MSPCSMSGGSTPGHSVVEGVLSLYPGGQVYKRRIQCGLEPRQPSKKDVMLTSLAKHSFGAILLVVIIEEVGIPLPIPSDFLVIFAGTMASRSLPRLGLFYVALTTASALGASGLYAMVRRGGRPLVEHFGRYVHLGPEQLNRAEALLSRSGWGGIAVGRATPGLRYATVIACGLLEVPYPRFVTATLIGSSVYVGAFLALGAIFGPSVLDLIHLPVLAVRLLWVLPLAVGLPLLVVWGNSRSRQPAHPSRGRVVSAALLGSFAGAIALAATVSATTTVAELLGASHPLNVAYAFLGWLMGAGPDVHATYLLLYTVLLLLLVGLSAAYYEFVLPYLAPRGISQLWQVLGLALLTLGVFGLLFASAAFLRRDDSFELWWQTGAPTILIGIACGVAVYALTAVYGRALAIAVAPTLRW
jgi:membrane protein DedA with SNARE-associated domain